MQLENESIRRREALLQQQLDAAEQTVRLQTTSRSRQVSSTHSPPVSGPLPTLTVTTRNDTTISTPDLEATSSSRNINQLVAQIPDSDPGKSQYDMSARKATVLASMFPTRDDLRRPAPNFDLDSNQRFATPENSAKGHAADFFAVFPPECHGGLRGLAVVQKAVRPLNLQS